MKLLLIYLTSEKEKTKDKYLYDITNAKTLILIEDIILILATAILFVVFQFNIILLLPIAFSIYNLVFTFMNIKKAENALKQKSPKNQVQFYGSYFFYILNKLVKELNAKAIPQEDVDQWTNHYITAFKSELSLKNFKEVCKKLEAHIESVHGSPYKLNNAELKKYKKNELKIDRDKWFPEIEELIRLDKISIKVKPIMTSNSNSDEIQRNLRLLGLSANTKNLKIITERYYQLVKIYHPDHSEVENAEKKLSEINQAYAELKKYFKTKR